jgi:hypothetical protein
LNGNGKAEPLVNQSQRLMAKADKLEEKLHNPNAQVVYDILAQKGGAKLYSQLGALYEWITDSDGPITQGMREVYAERSQELERLGGEFDILVSELVRLNELARNLEIPSVIVPNAKSPTTSP